MSANIPSVLQLPVVVVVASHHPHSHLPVSQSSTDPMLQVAICNLVKHLARSPKFLRDELISSGVIDPLLEVCCGVWLSL